MTNDKGRPVNGAAKAGCQPGSESTTHVAVEGLETLTPDADPVHVLAGDDARYAEALRDLGFQVVTIPSWDASVDWSGLDGFPARMRGIRLVAGDEVDVVRLKVVQTLLNHRTHPNVRVLSGEHDVARRAADGEAVTYRRSGGREWPIFELHGGGAPGTGTRADRHIDYREPRVFPLEALGPEDSLLRRWTEAVAASAQVHPAMTAAIALGLFSAALCGRVEALASSTWRTFTPLWIMPIAESGERKSPALKLGMQPLKDAEERLRLEDAVGDLPGQAGVDRATRESLYHAAVKARKSQEDKVAKAVADGATENIRDEKKTLANLVEAERKASGALIPPPRLLAADATPQALVGLLADQGGAIAMVSAEGSQVLHSLTGTRGNESPVGNILSAFDGESIVRDRVGERSVVTGKHVGVEIDHPCLTQVVAIQPGPVVEYMNRPDLVRVGFPWRWAFLPVPHWDQPLDPEPPALPGFLAQEVGNRVMALVRRFFRAEDVTQLRLAEDARPAWAEVAAWGKRVADPGSDLADIGAASWGSKAATLVLRLATVMTLAEDPDATLIAAEAIRRAFVLGQFFHDCAVEVFGGVDGDDVVAMRKVLEAIGSNSGKPRTSLKPWAAEAVETRKIMANVHYFRHKPVTRAIEVLRDLEARGYITKVHGPGTKTAESGWTWAFNESAVLAELDYLRKKDQATKATMKGHTK